MIDEQESPGANLNRLQRGVARAIGLDDVLTAQESQIDHVMDVMEHLISDNQMLQRQIEDMDYLNLFDMNSIQEVLPVRDRKKMLARLRRLRHDNPLAKQSVKLIIRFTLGKGIQWVLAEAPDDTSLTTAGDDLAPADEENESTGPRPPEPTKLIQLPRAARSRQEQVVDTSDEIRTILAAFWNAPDNKLAFTNHKAMQQMLDDIVTDGEKFYACFESEVEPYLLVSEIPLEEIDNTIYDPDNRLKPCLYVRRHQDQIWDDAIPGYKPVGKPKTTYYWDYRIKEEDKEELFKRIKVPKSKIDQDAKVRHVMINDLMTKNGKRGISELYASREWFRVFREFMEGRATINQAAGAISYTRKIKGSPATVARFSGKLGGLPVGDTSENLSDIRKLTKPLQGAVYDTNEGMDIDWMKTDTGAANAKEDARLLLATAGAGVGFMVHYYGEGGDANLATAQAMELPMVKTFEDWQQFVEDFILEWFRYVLRIANGEENSTQTEDDIQRVGIVVPPIVSQDVVKYTTSWAQIVRDISPNNPIVKKQAIRGVLAVMGVPNIDAIMPEIEAEMARAEAQRIQQQQMMAEALKNPLAPQVPNEALDPNTKHLAAGKGEKAANGPKTA